MNPTLTKYLPEKIQQHLSQLYLKNEADYWEQREILLPRYKGKWIAFDKRQVLMASENLDTVMDYVGSQRISAYIVRVGKEVVISKLREEYEIEEYTKIAHTVLERTKNFGTGKSKGYSQEEVKKMYGVS